MQLRNFFRRNDSHASLANHEGFSAVPVSGTATKDVQDLATYQLDNITDDGQFVRSSTSPQAKSHFWSSVSSSSSSSRSSTHTSISTTANEPFNMSRDSFDSYRRSFDISARSPIMHHFAASAHSHNLAGTEHETSTAESDFEHQLHLRWPDAHAADDDVREHAFEEVALHSTRARQQSDAGDWPAKDALRAAPARSAFAGFLLFGSRRGMAHDSGAEVHEGEMSDLTAPSSAGSGA